MFVSYGAIHFYKMSNGSNFDRIDTIQIKSVNSISMRYSYIE